MLTFLVAALLHPTILHRLATSVFDLASLFCVEAVLLVTTLQDAPNTPTETILLGPYRRHLQVQQDQPRTRTTTIGPPLRKGRSAIGSCQRESSKVSIVPTRTGGEMRRLGPDSHIIHNIPLTRIMHWYRVRMPFPGMNELTSLVVLEVRMGTETVLGPRL